MTFSRPDADTRRIRYEGASRLKRKPPSLYGSRPLKKCLYLEEADQFFHKTLRGGLDGPNGVGSVLSFADDQRARATLWGFVLGDND